MNHLIISGQLVRALAHVHLIFLCSGPLPPSCTSLCYFLAFFFVWPSFSQLQIYFFFMKEKRKSSNPRSHPLSLPSPAEEVLSLRIICQFLGITLTGPAWVSLPMNQLNLSEECSPTEGLGAHDNACGRWPRRAFAWRADLECRSGNCSKRNE